MNEQALMMFAISSSVGAYFFSLSSSLLLGEAYKIQTTQVQTPRPPPVFGVVQHTGPSTISSPEASTYRLLKIKVMVWGLSFRKADIVG